MSKNPYLNEFELQQVLALIALLATSVNPGGHTQGVIEGELPRGGRGRGWLTIAEEHSEFFGVIGESKLLRLWSRFNQPDNARPALGPNHTSALQEIAVKLHESACRLEDQRTKWRDLIIASVVALIVGAMGSDLIGWINRLVTQ